MQTREHLTHRTHLLMAPSMAQTLEQRALREGVSIAGLIREAVARQLLDERQEARRADFSSLLGAAGVDVVTP